MKQVNTKGFSIIIALALTIVMVLLVLYILEYMIPYSRNVKGIENSTNAFYQAESGIESGLYFFKARTNIVEEENKNFVLSNPVDYKFTTTSSGSQIPEPGFGNSDFDSNANTLSVGNPIQLQIGGDLDIDWGDSDTHIKLKVPDLSRESGTDEVFTGGTDHIVVNWQLSSDSNSLNSSGSYLMADEICDGNESMTSCGGKKLDGRGGIDLNGLSNDFVTYYGNNCDESTESCTLKLSVINRLETNSNNTPLPYLEYAFNFEFSGVGSNVPLRFSRINSTGKSYGFQKNLQVRVPQQTTNEAFDFTVFQ